MSLRMFLGEHQVLPSGKPGWLYVSVLISVGAFAAGGIKAARGVPRGQPAMAARTAAELGPVVAVAGFAFALFHVSGHGSGGLIATAIFLPLLWAGFSAAGALLDVNQRGTPLHVTFAFHGPKPPPATPTQPTAPPPAGWMPPPPIADPQEPPPQVLAPNQPAPTQPAVVHLPSVQRREPRRRQFLR